MSLNHRKAHEMPCISLCHEFLQADKTYHSSINSSKLAFSHIKALTIGFMFNYGYIFETFAK